MPPRGAILREWLRDKLTGNLEDWWHANRRLLAPVRVRILLATATARSTANLTTNVTSYAGTAFTPAASELCVAFVTVTASRIDSGNGRASLSDTQALGWVLVDFAQKATSADSCYVFVASKLAANSATTPTFDCTGDAGTGATIQVFGISGMTRTGIDAVRQTAKQNNQAAGTPGPVFANACLTGNVVAGVVNNATSPATMTPPTSWTEGDDTGYLTPTTGAEYAFINSGFTGTTVTWGSASASAFCSLVIEFDTTTATSSTPYLALTGAVASGTATLTVVPPTGIANNDIPVLIVEQSDTAAITGMAGYTQKWQFTNGTVIRQTGLWKRSNGTESNVTVTYSGGATISAYIVVWRGCITTGDPFDGTPVSQNGTATTTITAPSYTPTTTPTGIGFAAHGGINNTSGSPAIQVWSGTYPTFIETVENIGNLGASTVSIGHAWGGAKATTALGARTVTDTGEAATPNTLGTIYAMQGQPTTSTKAVAAVVAGVGAVAAALSVTKSLATAVAGHGVVTANLIETKRLNTTVAGTSTVSASRLNVTRSLATRVTGLGAVVADLTTSAFKTLSTTVVGQATISAAMTISSALRAIVSGSSQVLPALNIIGQVFTPTVTTALLRRRRMLRESGSIKPRKRRPW